MTKHVAFAVAFPVKEEDRARVRVAIGMKLPLIVPGSVPGRCHDCDMELGVGPRTAAALAAIPTVVILCPLCLQKHTNPDDEVLVANLGNPDSRYEQ